MSKKCCCYNEKGHPCRRKFIPKNPDELFCWQHSKRCDRHQSCANLPPPMVDQQQQLEACEVKLKECEEKDKLKECEEKDNSIRLSRTSINSIDIYGAISDEESNEREPDKVLMAQKVTKKIGTGAFGDVYLGLALVDGKNREVAYKRIPRSKAKDAVNEAAIQSQLSKYPNCENYIACIYDSFYDNQRENFYITVEYIRGMDMYDFTKKNRDLVRNKKFLDECFENGTSGLMFMHSKGVAHGDIKLENLMWDTRNNILKYIDFGKGCNSDNCSLLEVTPYGSTFMFPPEYFSTRGIDKDADLEDSDDLIRQLRIWINSPQRLPKTLKDLIKVDVWALGYVFFDILLMGEHGKFCADVGLDGRVKNFSDYLARKGYVIPAKKHEFIANAMTEANSKTRISASDARDLLVLNEEDIEDL